jgi:sec-independent protein translocase protein TatC
MVEPQLADPDDAVPDPVEAQLDDGRMSFVEHLRDLRTRIRNSIIYLIGGFAIAYLFKQEILVFLLQPLLDVWRKYEESIGPPSLFFGSLIDPFWGYFSLALWAGVFLASPFIFHQLWLFVAPGLYKRERRLGVVFAITSAICFIGGAIFCYYLVLPPVFDFLLGYSTDNLASITHDLGIKVELQGNVALHPLLTMNEYVSFARKLLIGFGVIFELPLVIFFLSLIGMVNHRSLWKFNRWFIVLSFVIAALLTPPDVVSQLLMAGPLVVLYNLSIILSYVVTRRRERKQAAAG